MRPGRFDRLVFVDLPDVNDRREIILKCLENTPMEPDLDFDEISKRVHGF